MIGLLQAGKGHNVDSLAAHCGISRRTVFLDLEVLCQAGVPLKLDDEFQVYHHADTFFLPPTKFTEPSISRGVQQLEAEVIKPAKLCKLVAIQPDRML
jgi:predicted DNA-binding transcriptional regulator YafY